MNVPSTRVSRREVLAAATGLTILPAHVLGRGGAIPPSEKLNIGFIGIGGRGEISVRELSNQNMVAFCDADWHPIPNYHRPRASEVAKRFPNVRRYDDWRIMLQEEDKNIDAVVVATPDHHHAFASISAMKMGKHVYCEKPLAHSIHEVRAMMEAENKYKVATQTGNQGHSSDDLRSIVEWVRDGAIGDVREVHLFLRIGVLGVAGGMARGEPQYADIPKILAEEPAAPEGLKWDQWIGPAPYRKYNAAYLPNAWRRWVDFGTGTLGDYNCHYMDAALWALDLEMPEKIEANPEAGYDWATNKQTFPNSFEVRWDFPARGSKPPVALTWHYGKNSGSVPLPKGWKEGDKLSEEGGGIIYGSRGAIVYGPIFSSLPQGALTGGYTPAPWGTPEKVRLYPEELDKSYKRPAKTLPRPFNHWMDWVEAAKAGKQGGSHFGYGGILTQVALLGNIALRQKGKVLYYDAKAGRFRNNEEANRMFERPYREGWKLPV